MQVKLPGQGRALALALVVGLGVAPTQPLMAQAFKTTVLAPAPAPVRVEGELVTSETAQLLTGLTAIERDMMLRMLFLQDGLTSTVGSHFTHPRQESWPLVKDALAAAGIADIEPLLVALEAETDAAAVTKAQNAVTAAVLTAQSALKPSDQDRIMAVLAGIRAAHDRFNPAGATEVIDVQDGWAGLMIERGKVDLLLKSTDPVIVQGAKDMGRALDDVILSLPDPAITAPISFDPTPVAALLARLEALAGAA